MPTNLPEYVSPASMEVLYSREQIAERVRAIGKQISEEYAGQAIVLIGVVLYAVVWAMKHL